MFEFMLGIDLLHTFLHPLIEVQNQDHWIMSVEKYQTHGWEKMMLFLFHLTYQLSFSFSRRGKHHM